MSKKILGISCYYHDSAAALIIDGEIISAAQEERFTRKKHDASFPSNAVKYCLSQAKIRTTELDSIVYYEKPLLTFERLLETYLGAAPRGGRSFVAAMQVWLKEKLFIKQQLKKEFISISGSNKNFTEESLPEILYSEHHLSHAAAAFYPSPFEEAVILCMDGVGEWATTTAWKGKGNNIEPLWEINFPHSLGLLYSAFTYYCGFKVNSGEYKLMGLAPYGDPIYVDAIKKNLIDIKEDGTFRLDMSYFKFHRGFRMTGRKFHKLFGRKPRKGESKLEKFHMDLASSIQVVTEEVMLKICSSLQRETGAKYLCLAGGVALNCVANGKLIQQTNFDDIWIQPASGDAGSALGAGLIGWHQYFKGERSIKTKDSMKGSYLGPLFSNKEIEEYLSQINVPFQKLDDSALFTEIAMYLAEGKVIGWFNGRMEFGPRALGNRSIIGDPRKVEMQKTMNLKIKYRESFRPFAPSILEEDLRDYFDLDKISPYMLLVAPIKNEIRQEMTLKQKELFGIDKLNIPRSEIPAVTHVDYSARVQTVNIDSNPRYYNLIKAFKKITSCPVIVNTSFNVRGEPIVCSPQDAYRCFMRTEMDFLVLENYILKKSEQPISQDGEDWKEEFELD